MADERPGKCDRLGKALVSYGCYFDPRLKLSNATESPHCKTGCSVVSLLMFLHLPAFYSSAGDLFGSVNRSVHLAEIAIRPKFKRSTPSVLR